MAPYTLDFKTPIGNKSILTDTRVSTQRGNIKALALRLTQFQLNQIPSESDEKALATELDYLRQFDELLSKIPQMIAQREWAAIAPQNYQVLLVALNELKFRVNKNIFKIQATLHNFEPYIMEAVGFDLDKLFEK